MAWEADQPTYAAVFAPPDAVERPLKRRKKAAALVPA